MKVDEFDIDKAEEAVNKTYPGLTMFVRDVNLPDALAEKYIPDLVIKERGFTDASCRVGGMITTHRFGILSNHMADLRKFEHGTNWGLCMAQSGSRFKVLGSHIHNGKTLILLLHLPNDESWELIAEAHITLDDQIIITSIERFMNKCDSEPILELTTEEWLDRCKDPLGMDDEGNLFEVEDEEK